MYVERCFFTLSRKGTRKFELYTVYPYKQLNETIMLVLIELDVIKEKN
mgnify:CR=1 FL=1